MAAYIMRHPHNYPFGAGLLCALALATVACGPKRMPSTTVTDLMEDRVALDGVLLKCDHGAGKDHNETECSNARIAVERLAQHVDPQEEAKRNAEFEQSRDRLRTTQERARREREAQSQVDPYSLPVVPMEPPPASPPGPGSSAAPLTGQVRP